MTCGVNEEEVDQPKIRGRSWMEKSKSPAEAHQHRGDPVFVHFMPGTSLKVKCWEGSGRMLSAYGGRFRINDLGGGVSKAVTSRRKGVNKVG